MFFLQNYADYGVDDEEEYGNAGTASFAFEPTEYGEAGIGTRCLDGANAMPEGFKYERFKMSKVKTITQFQNDEKIASMFLSFKQSRKKAREAVQRLCAKFQLPKTIKHESMSLLKQLRCRDLEAGAAAIVITLVRQYEAHVGSGGVITLRQAAGFLGITVHRIGAMLKRVEALLHAHREDDSEEEQANNASAVVANNVEGFVQALFGGCHLLHPFSANDDITKKVCKFIFINFLYSYDRIYVYKMMAIKLLQVLAKAVEIINLLRDHSDRGGDPNMEAVACALISWQSYFFYEASQSLPNLALVRFGKMGTLDEFLRLAGVSARDISQRRSIQTSYERIIKYLKQLLDKMTWIRIPDKDRRRRDLVPEYLNRILEYQSFACQQLAEEAEQRRQQELQNQPAPVIPRGN